MIPRWWHKVIRKRTKPIPGDVALLWKRRLTFIYSFFAWNAFGLVVYNISQGKADWADYHGLKTEEEKALAPAHAWANTLGIKNAKVMRISGLSKVDEYEIVDGQQVRPNKTQTNVVENDQ